MPETYKKIDAHGHFGPSFLGPASGMSVYLEQAKMMDVVACVASPGPNPKIIGTNEIYYPCVWKETSNGIEYFQRWESLDGKELETDRVEANPYYFINRDLLKAKGINNGIDVNIMPLHHPLFDTSLEVKKLLFTYPSIALKLHGIATYTGPKNVSASTIDHLKASDKPLIVHTDTYIGKVTNVIQRAYQLNDPMDWVEWAEDTQVKTLITHGARLSESAIELAKRCPNIMIGIAPDLLLATEPERLYNHNSYLETLLALAGPDKLLFDIDYGWNVKERNAWHKLDWEIDDRIISTAQQLDFSESDLSKIFFDNAVKFYDL